MILHDCDLCCRSKLPANQTTNQNQRKNQTTNENQTKNQTTNENQTKVHPPMKIKEIKQPIKIKQKSNHQ
jgi:hypothetical protein